MLAQKLRNVKSRLLANSNNVIKLVSVVHEYYDNCQLLQPVNEFVERVPVTQPRDMDHRRLAIPLTTSISSQNLSHPVFQRLSSSSLRLHDILSSSIPVWLVWIPFYVVMQVARLIVNKKVFHTLLEVKLLQ